ncbi:MAG: WD40 repeat domain-containing protein [Bacteroidia bacterium]|nr:WD40 repeat domain-containing protein [Bacteroidia bacterium]MCZ2248921.1 WD40 repeat domain-containing protein [Bacteroidia bacterium]
MTPLLNIHKEFHFTGHQASVYALSNSHSPFMFYSGSSDKILARWDIKNKQADNFSAKMPSAIYKIHYDEINNYLYVGTGVGSVHIIDLNKKEELKFFKLHEKGQVFDIALHPTHSLMFSGSSDGTVVCLHTSNFEMISKVKICNQKVRSLHIIPEESVLLATCGSGYIKLLEIPSLKVLNEFFAHNLSANKVIKHPTQNILLSGGRDAYLNVWDWPSLKILLRIPAHNYAIYDICFSPDNKLMATASRDKNIKIWNSDNISLLYRIDKEKNNGHINSVNKLLWSSHQNILVSSGDDRSIMGWRITEGNE